MTQGRVIDDKNFKNLPSKLQKLGFS